MNNQRPLCNHFNITPACKECAKFQADIYADLKSKGFEEIEDISLDPKTGLPKNEDRPLLEWHSLKFRSKALQARMIVREGYQKKIEDFTNSKELDEAANFISKPGNHKIRPDEAKKIWVFHTQGHTVRAIAKLMGCSSTKVQTIITRLREWMQIAQ